MIWRKHSSNFDIFYINNHICYKLWKKMKWFSHPGDSKPENENETKVEDEISLQEEKGDSIENELQEMLDDLTEVYKKGTKRAADYMVNFARNKIAPLIKDKLVLDPKSKFDPKTFEIFEVISEDSTALSDRKYVTKTQIIPEYNVTKDAKNNTIQLAFSGDFSYKTINSKDHDAFSTLQASSCDSYDYSTYTDTQGGTIYTKDDISLSTANYTRGTRQENDDKSDNRYLKENFSIATSFQSQDDDWTATKFTSDTTYEPNGDESLCDTMETIDTRVNLARDERYISNRRIATKISSCSTDSFLNEVLTPHSEHETDANIKMIRRKKMYSKMSTKRLQKIVENDSDIDSDQLTNDKYFQAFQSNNDGNRWNVTLPIILENDVELKLVSFDDSEDFATRTNVATDEVESETKEDLNNPDAKHERNTTTQDDSISINNAVKLESTDPSQANNIMESSSHDDTNHIDSRIVEASKIRSSKSKAKVKSPISRHIDELEPIIEQPDHEGSSNSDALSESSSRDMTKPTNECNGKDVDRDASVSQRDEESSYSVPEVCGVDDSVASGLSKDESTLQLIDEDRNDEISKDVIMRRTMESMNESALDKAEIEETLNTSKIVVFQDEYDLIILHTNEDDSVVPLEAVEMFLSNIKTKKEERVKGSKNNTISYNGIGDNDLESRDDSTSSPYPFKFTTIQINKPFFSEPAEEERYNKHITKLTRISVCESVASAQNNLSKRCMHSVPHSLQMIKPSRKVVTKEEVKRANEIGKRNAFEFSGRVVTKRIGLGNKVEKLNLEESYPLSTRSMFKIPKTKQPEADIPTPPPTSPTSEKAVKSLPPIKMRNRLLNVQKTSIRRHGKPKSLRGEVLQGRR